MVAPEIYAEEFSAALDFLGTTTTFIDRNRIGVLGICGSGSFVISAAKIDPRMIAIATVSMYDMGAVSRNALHHSPTVAQRKKSSPKPQSSGTLRSLVGKQRKPAEPCMN